ncbi:MBL fold hydrolase, partial [Pseudoalteromonas rubra]
PLDFDNIVTIDTHQQHVQLLQYLKQRQKPAIVIAASGMCSGGRIVNYLVEFLPEPTTDVSFVGYQGAGTPGRAIQKYGPQGG